MGKIQFHTGNSETYIKVPTNVKKEAIRAFDLRKKGFKGATETGWRRAHQLATKEEVSIENFRFIKNWYARHLHTSYPTFKRWKEAGSPETKGWYNKRGILSWLTWGGDPGLKWVNLKGNVSKLNKFKKKLVFRENKKLSHF